MPTGAITGTMDHAHIHPRWLTDEAEIERLLDMAVRILLRPLQLPRSDHRAILAADADRQGPGIGDQAGDVFVDGAGQHHLHHLHHRRVGHPQPVDEGGLNRQAFQHRIDLRPAAMHHHRVDPDLLQQRDIVAELLRQVLLAHRVATILHHHRRAGIASQEGQGLRQYMRLFPSGLDVDGGGGCFRHTGRVGRPWGRGQEGPLGRLVSPDGKNPTVLTVR
jgi:hypothetical protein